MDIFDNNSEKTYLSKRLAGIRKRGGYTQEGFAEKIGLTAGHVGALEQGQSLPSYTALHRMRETLGISLDELFESTRRESGDGEPWWEAEIVSVFAPLMAALTDEKRREVLTAIKSMAALAKLPEDERSHENSDLRRR
jgi:transcriptional regulator with XRE-family HTH domain